MGEYQYVSVLRALNDGKPPNEHIQEGDEIIKPGNHDDDKITYISEDNNIETIRLEQSELLDAGKATYSKEDILDWAEYELFGEEDS